MTWEDVRVVPGFLVIVLAVYAIARRAEVRLTLLLAGLALGTLAGDPMAIVRKFLTTFTDEKFVVPLCTALGFAYVLRHTQCDQHLVHLLMKPLRHARFFLIPGTVIVGFLVNIPIVSQTSTAVTIGTVVVPLLLAMRLSPATAGAALLLGSSIGGELLNPAAPELRTVVSDSLKRNVVLTSADCVERIAPLLFLALAVAVGVLWFLAVRAEARYRDTTPSPNGQSPAPGMATFRVNLLKALVPLVPLTLLYLTSAPLYLIPIDDSWLLGPDAPPERRESWLIGTAMLIGSAVATLAVWRKAGSAAVAFFDGAGYAFGYIIALIVAASCFGEGIRLIGIAQGIGTIVHEAPLLLLPMAGVVCLGFALLCGSGMATAQSLFAFFADAGLLVGADLAHVGAVVSIAAAAGRTMSPVAAVVLMCAAMTKTEPLTLVKRVAPALLASTAVMIVAAMLIAP